jgi:glycosyltransferase involved in cell wall biosynthesis
MMRCSVVIPTYRRPELLARVLEALTLQTIAPDEFEIIVCDDAGSDETRAQVEQWSSHHGVAIRYVRGAAPRQGPAAMRNAGWRAARGPIIAFTDDDTIPDPDWIRQGLIALGDDDADAASGHVVVPLPDDPTDYERDAARLEGAGFVTANCFCRRAVLACLGGFDPRFRAAWREDSDLFFRLIANGFDVVYAIGAIVVHPVRPEPWGVSLRAEQKHVFDALLYKKHPTLYAQFIRPDRPYLYYAILAALATGVAGVFSDSLSLTMTGLASWAVLTLVLIARRLRATRRTLDHVAEVVVTSLLIPALSVYHRIRGGVAFRVAFW